MATTSGAHDPFSHAAGLHGGDPGARGSLAGDPPSPRSRSTRGRPSKSPLSAEAIIDAALAICRAETLDAVTMRRVAAELDTGPASLYVYIQGREELLREMLDRVAGEIALPQVEPARWREQVHGLVEGWLRAMEAHPGIASVAVGNPPASERTMIVADHLMALLLAGGVTPQDAAWACDILPLITTATAVETDVHRARGHTVEETVARIEEAVAALPPERFPNLARYGAELVTGDGDERFHFAIDVFLDGLVARGSR